MGTLRTLEHIAEEYTESRAALSRAKQALAYAEEHGGTNVSVQRDKVRELERSVRDLDEEYTRAERGHRIVVRSGVALHD